VLQVGTIWEWHRVRVLWRVPHLAWEEWQAKLAMAVFLPGDTGGSSSGCLLHWLLYWIDKSNLKQRVYCIHQQDITIIFAGILRLSYCKDLDRYLVWVVLRGDLVWVVGQCHLVSVLVEWAMRDEAIPVIPDERRNKPGRWRTWGPDIAYC